MQRTHYLALALVLLAATALLGACNNSNSKLVVAEADGKTLYLSDVPDIFPEGTTKEDSVALLTTYANSWVRKQLTLIKAEENLSLDKKNVQLLMDDYRTSLLTYRYEQEYVNQRLDTLVSQEEVEAFYEANKDKLKLSIPLAKAVFIKVQSTSPRLKQIKELYRLTTENGVKELEDLCLQAAEKYDYFNDDWVDFSILTKSLPQAPSVYEADAQSKRYIEEKDDTYTYLIGIREFIPRGGFAPMSHERKVIISIILNNRKQKLLSELEQKIYDDAIQQNKVNINVGQP